MRRTLLGLAVAGAICIPSIANAQTPAPDDAVRSSHTLTGNVTLVSDYRFRGISQTYEGPAIQGGFDYSHASGFYLGNWNSNVASQVYTGGSGIEMDVYGGYKRSFGDFGFDIGYLYYYYPRAEFESTDVGSQRFDTQEIYLGGSWKWISLKVFLAVSDYFGLGSTQVNGGYWASKSDGSLLPDRGGSRNSSYLDLTANIPVGDKLTIGAHVGSLKAKNYGELDYTRLEARPDVQREGLAARRGVRGYRCQSRLVLHGWLDGQPGDRDGDRRGFRGQDILSGPRRFRRGR